MIYIAIEKSSGIVRGMGERIGDLKEMVRDGKRRISEYHYVALSDMDYEYWCAGRAKLQRDARQAHAKKVMGL